MLNAKRKTLNAERCLLRLASIATKIPGVLPGILWVRRTTAYMRGTLYKFIE
jgi:hypothetical protein